MLVLSSRRLESRSRCLRRVQASEAGQVRAQTIPARQVPRSGRGSKYTWHVRRLTAKVGPTAADSYTCRNTTFFERSGVRGPMIGGRLVWNSDLSLDFGRGDLMLLNLLIKRTAWNAETFGRLLNTSLFLLQHTLDVLFFEFQKSQS